MPDGDKVSIAREHGRRAGRRLTYMPLVFALALAGFVASGVLATVHGPERPR